MSVEMRNPLEWIGESSHEVAVRDLATYMASYSGRHFERFAARTDPNRFGADDVIAVSCLSVEVPPEVAAWLLLGDGAEACAALLRQMPPPAAHIRDTDPAADGAANELWALLSQQHQLGPTIVSKLMAAKRPRLIPIFDSFVADALLDEKDRKRWSWWTPWHRLLAGPNGAAILEHVEAIRAAVPEANGLSDLRILDIVIWMSEEERRRSRRRQSR